MNPPKLDTRRRNFLTAAACAPAIAVGVLLTRRQEVAMVEDLLPADEPASSGYHETEHVRKYYRTASF